MTARNKRQVGAVITASLVLALLYLTMRPAETEFKINLSDKSGGLQAIYRRAIEKPDGSIDLVFNIPKGGKYLVELGKQLNDEETLSSTTVRAINTTANARRLEQPLEVVSTKTGIRYQTKTSYPISLDADYVIKPIHICPSDQPIDYIVIIHSATAYFDRRRTIRETYGGRRIFGHISQRIIFLLGTTTDPATTKQIREEALMYEDIVQGPFTDSYHNLTHKGVLGYRWVAEHCSQAKIVIKLDDDVFMNPFRVVKYLLPKYSPKKRSIACHLRKGGTSPIVRGKGKWQVSDNEFKNLTHFPFDYCNGYFVVITRDLIKPMLAAARLNPFFWIDDVYLFGLLPATVGSVEFENIGNNLTLRYEAGKKCLEEKGSECPYVGVSQYIEDKSDLLWYQVLTNLTETSKAEFHLFGKH